MKKEFITAMKRYNLFLSRKVKRQGTKPSTSAVTTEYNGGDSVTKVSLTVYQLFVGSVNVYVSLVQYLSVFCAEVIVHAGPYGEIGMGGGVSFSQ